MNTTDIREALDEVKAAVEVPLADEFAVRGRARAEGRRRTAVRVATAFVGVSAAALAIASVSATLTDGPEPAREMAATPVANPRHTVGFVVEGKLVVGGASGYHPVDLPARNVLGLSGQLLVLSDNNGALIGVPVDEEGWPGKPQTLRSVVDQVWLDPASELLIARDPDGGFVSRSRGAQEWTSWGPPNTGIFLTDGFRRVESGPDGLTLRTSGGKRHLPAGGGVTGGGFAGGTLVIETAKALRFYDADTGRRLAVVPGEASGALSADGTSYVGTVGGRLVLVDPRSGVESAIKDPPAQTGDIGWTSDDTFVVVSRRGPDGERTLWECRVDTRFCEPLYGDPSGTLQLHS
jgi:hypothetical protein